MDTVTNLYVTNHASVSSWMLSPDLYVTTHKISTPIYMDAVTNLFMPSRTQLRLRTSLHSILPKRSLRQAARGMANLRRTLQP